MRGRLRVVTAIAVCAALVAAAPARAVIQGMPSGFIEETVAPSLGFPTAIAFLPSFRKGGELGGELVDGDRGEYPF